MNLQAIAQETINEMNQREYERDLNTEIDGDPDLDRGYEELNIDELNADYFAWISAWEGFATPDAGFAYNMDVDYSIVDSLFEQGYSPEEAVTKYWEMA